MSLVRRRPYGASDDEVEGIQSRCGVMQHLLFIFRKVTHSLPI